MTLLANDTKDLIEKAIENYRDVISYQVTVKSTAGDQTQVIHYSFRKPGHVRMEFVTPHHGAALIYDPDARKATLWPFGYHSFPSMSLSPDNSLIQGAGGQRVDRSDVGFLYESVKQLQDHGRAEVIGTEEMGGQLAVHVDVRSNDDSAVGHIARYQLWLEQSSGFPLKVLSYARDGKLIETVEMEDLRINPELPPDFFNR